MADAHGSVTPRPPETKRPATTPPEGPSVAACRDVIVPVTGTLPPPAILPFPQPFVAAHVSLTKPSTRRSGLDFALGDSTVAVCSVSIPHHRSSFMRTSDNFCPEQVATKGVCVGESEHKSHREFHF